MTKFRVGDRVRRVGEPLPSFPIGWEGTVTRERSFGWFEVDGVAFLAEYFELVVKAGINAITQAVEDIKTVRRAMEVGERCGSMHLEDLEGMLLLELADVVLEQHGVEG
jgi:hypothetical protein